MGILKKLLLLLPSVALLVGNIFVFGPETIYKSNAEEFDVGFFNVFPSLVLVAFLFSLLLMSFGAWLRGRYFEIFCCVLNIGAILTWIQGNLLVWPYGVLDGNEIQWEQLISARIVDLATWVLLSLAIVKFRTRIGGMMATLCTILFLAQITILVIDVANDESGHFKKRNAALFPPADIHEYSDHTNIVHVLLDGFQTEVFLEIVEEERLKDDLDGFTVFPENISRYDGTLMSLATIFGGVEYPRNISYADYVKGAISRNGILPRLKENGFRINFIPHIVLAGNLFDNYFKVPIAYGSSQTDAERWVAAQLVDLSLFRHSPGDLRRLVYNRQRWTMQRLVSVKKNVGYWHQIEFFKDYMASVKGGGAEPVYHYIHLVSPHPPYLTNERCERQTRLRPSRKAYKIQAKCTLLLIERFLRTLKKIGVYENSLIVIHADHGFQYPVAMKDSPGGHNNFNEASYSVVGRATALLAVKFPGERGEMVVSDALSTTLDIPKTILGFAGIDADIGDQDLRNLEGTRRSERRYEDSVANGDFVVTGSAYKHASWQKEERGEIKIEASRYVIGKMIAFSAFGNAQQYCKKGWSWGDEEASWTNGKEAEIDIPFDRGIARDLTLTAVVYPFRGRQRVGVSVNGVFVEMIEVIGSKFQRIEIKIPRDIVSSQDTLHIMFELPDAISPKEIDVSPDSRVLGIRVKEMILKDSVT